MASKLNAVKLEIEELRLNVVQREVAIRAMTKTVLQLEKRVVCIEAKKQMLLQVNEELLLGSSLTMNHPSEKKLW